MPTHSESLISNEKACFVTGRTDCLDRHHVYRSSRRKASEKYGLWVYLNHDVHMALHDHRKPYETLENDLKVIAQEAFENNGGTREEFMEIFGCNYL